LIHKKKGNWMNYYFLNYIYFLLINPFSQK
jgi:hypothetical protein